MIDKIGKLFVVVVFICNDEECDVFMFCVMKLLLDNNFDMVVVEFGMLLVKVVSWIICVFV